MSNAPAPTESAVPAAGPPTSGWADWFDHWPEMFARRWPDAFRNLPMWGEMFRLEQFTDDDGALVIRAELPGIDPGEDVHVAVHDGQMTISGERRSHTESEEKDTYRTEFQYGSFSRSIRLPAGAVVDEIGASYRDGILEVRVPVDEDRPGVTKVPIATD